MKILRTAFFLTLSASALLGCSQSDEPATGRVAATGDSTEAKVEALLATLTLEQKIAQMVQGEVKHVTPDDLRQYGLGSVLNGGGSFPANNKQATVGEWLALADAYYEASVDTSAGSAGIPVIWGTDAVHGHNNVIGATLFPHNIGLGAMNDADVVAQIAAATAREVKATGIDWIFAPTIAVAKDYRWGRTYESYSSDPALVASYAGGFVEAMQGEGIVATAKHFIGDGATYAGDDQGDARLSLDELVAEHGAGYVPAFESGVMSVMASFNSWNGDKVHGSKTLLTDVLRDQMGFDGFVVSDWNGIGQVKGCTADNCAQAINAGIDMVMAPEDWKSLMVNLKDQVESGEISEARIDEAVRRILTVKFDVGLMDRAKPSVEAERVIDQIGSDAHRALAREAVRRSQVLLKNEGGLLPLDPRGTYLVVGHAADDIGLQSGGWTVSWQGTGNVNSDFPGGTSILAGLQAQVEAAGGQLYTEANLPTDVTPDAVLVVYGEMPYAEGQGDLWSLSWRMDEHRGLDELKRYQSMDLPTVSVFLTGRPRWVNAEINASDAFLVAWLPGSEGAGVADVLLRDAGGAVQYEFTGRLPMAWPNADVNGEDANLPVADVLFPRGYGLDSRATESVATLSEEHVGKTENAEEALFRGGAVASGALLVGDDLNWEVEVGPRGARTQRGGLEISVIDHRIQEDSRRLTWKTPEVEPKPGAERASQAYWFYDTPKDLAAQSRVGGALLLELRLMSAPTAPVTVRMDCSYPCSAALDLTGLLNSKPQQEWYHLALPLECFANAGADMMKVTSPLLLSTAGEMTLDISEVVITEEPVEGSLVACAAMPPVDA